MKYILWKDTVIGKYCLTPVEVEDPQDLIKWLKKEMAGFAYPRIVENYLKTYRGKEVVFIPSLELQDCYKTGKSIHSFYYDYIQ